MINISIANTASHPSKIDSLQAQVSHLVQQVDSLNKVSIKLTSATEFYHDVINMHVATVIGIIGFMIAIGALVSWGALSRRFLAERNILHTELTSRIDAQENNVRLFLNKYSDDSKENTKNYERLRLSINKATYQLMVDKKLYALMLKFGLECVVCYQNLSQPKSMLRFLNLVKIALDGKEFKKGSLKDFKKDIELFFAKLKINVTPEFLEVLNNVEMMYLRAKLADTEDTPAV